MTKLVVILLLMTVFVFTIRIEISKLNQSHGSWEEHNGDWRYHVGPMRSRYSDSPDWYEIIYERMGRFK